MRFTRLRLNGFKSFVDPTDLVIADGLTGVVGPNGCGKSNLLEALRWVMGENRPTAMRGGGMEDVIFAGASTRGARNFAEVAIHIDNSDRLAPAAFNDADLLDVTRRITRDVGSAYKANGKEIRARDVQMLFADASTGAHSPALVRQGQISELINAKPRNRRRVLEEAAGISGLYQRRHEAELKLKGAEANLLRVDDVIEQLASQLATLARQAKQAARYREIGAELRQQEGMLLYRRWREADLARGEADVALRTAMTLASRAEADARAAALARGAAEEALPPLREEATIAAAVLQRFAVERDALTEKERQAAAAIETLTGRLKQLTADRDREAGLERDAGETIARLSKEADEIEAGQPAFETRLAEAEAAARSASARVADDEAALAEVTEAAARLAARHQSAERRVTDARTVLDRNRGEADKARDARAAAEAALAQAAAAMATADDKSRTATETAAQAEDTLAKADAALGEVQGREVAARAARSEAEGELSALRAEAQALQKLVARDTAEGGQLLDLMRVAPGFEKALGAALADDLRSPVVGAEAATGWATLADYESVEPLPPGATCLGEHITAPDLLARRIARVGLVDAADGPRLQAMLTPGQRLVSREGDLWRWDGFRAGAEDAPSAAALRLQQLNRLEDLKQSVEAATARAEGAARAHESLERRLGELTRADQAARTARREADRMVAEASRALSRAEADRNIAEGKVESAGLAAERYAAEAERAAAELAEAEAARAALDDLGAARTEVAEVRSRVETARSAMVTAHNAHEDLKRQAQGRARRLESIGRERASWQQRLDTADARIAELDRRTTESETALSEASGEPERLHADRERLQGEIGKAEARKAAAEDALAGAEATLRDAISQERETERAASNAREARARSETRLEAANAAVEAAKQRIVEDLDTLPVPLLESLGVDPETMPDAEAIDTQVQKLRRQRDALGAVNLRAEEDAREVEAEHTTLLEEKADLEAAIARLRSGIASLNKEGRSRLVTAFDTVNKNFSMLFKHLFGGGEANLVLVESDDPLEAGLEIMCQPPGKKLSTLSLLSGGEQTLTALALIFGVFLANPAPICVLDEVDAPLDDANVTRFCDLLDEMTRRTETRFLIITHHAITMARMDRLFGVTMAEQGVSQLVSVDLKKAESMVA